MTPTSSLHIFPSPQRIIYGYLASHADGFHPFDHTPYIGGDFKVHPLLKPETPRLFKQHLPPGFTETQLQAFLADCRSIVGDEGICAGSDSALMEAYSDPFAVIDENEAFMSAAAVLPTTAEQVQEVVKIANRHKWPLWTVSRGRNLGYGGAAPRLRGSVVLDLKRLNRIISVNDRFCYALVEPGVTFFDLYDYCKQRKLKVWPSSPGLGWGSIVGNALDRGWGYTPSGEHSKVMCGLEVVLADGTFVRTGNGAIAGGNTWQLFQGGYGPNVEGLFQQSNMGVVTKMGIHLYPAPEGVMSCYVDVDKEEDLIPLVNILNQLRLKEIIGNNPVIGSLLRAASMLGPRTNFYSGEGIIPDDELAKLKERVNKGYWNATFALYGDKTMLDHRFAKIQAAFTSLPGCRLHAGKQFFGTDGDPLWSWDTEMQFGPMSTLHVGIPSIGALDSIRFLGENGGHIGFSPILPPDGLECYKFYKMAKAISTKHGFDFDAGLHVYARHVCSVTMTFFRRGDAAMRKRAADSFIELVEETRKLGYSEYRCHVNWMDLVADQYDFNDFALRKMVTKIKDTLDPNGILSPGKQGIWHHNQRQK